ncbi:CobW family GTP-binding protein [Yanghanlia caeni]|uniref:GTP-binding protein n=1 Tax=Yanghanlia caeni TaxID=3064283 RepID=A0ABU1D9E3_9BURK|nr:GTP-binding protein [Alcaligenaceae bacterium LG-2]
MASTAIPVILLTGFLGSGKTSLLRRLIRQPEFAQCAVVINEFGDIGLDQALVSDQSDDRDIQLLDSGCLCCMASTSIQDTLASLYYRRLREEIPWFDTVLIETSGLAEPGPIVNALYGDDTLNRKFRLAGIVTTFDAGFGKSQVDAYREAKLQLMMADVIVITKGDVHGAVDELSTQLGAMHPTARIITNQLDDAVLARTIRQTDEYRPANERTPVAAAPPPALPALRHVLAYGIYSVSVRIPEPVSWEMWAGFVRHVQRDFGDALLRFKGILAFHGEPRPMAVHGIHHLFSPPVPVDAAGDTIGSVVFIVRELERERIDAAVTHLLSFP